MPKFGVNIDANYRRFAQQTSAARATLRKTIHQPHRRATTRTLFLTGALTLTLIGGMTVGWLR